MLVCSGNCFVLRVCGDYVAVCAPSRWGKTTLMLEYYRGALDPRIVFVASETAIIYLDSTGARVEGVCEPLDAIYFIGDEELHCSGTLRGVPGDGLGGVEVVELDDIDPDGLLRLLLGKHCGPGAGADGFCN